MSATLDDILRKLNELQQDIDEVFRGQVLSANQLRVINGLSDIDVRLGLVQAGEFRAGNGLDPDHGFSGVRIAYPPMTYDGEEWNIVGIDNDTLQVGIRASDGKFFGGGGDVIIDTGGIVIKNNQEAAFSFEDNAGNRDTIYMVSTLDNGLVTVNTNIDGETTFRQKITGASPSSAYLKLMEDPTQAGRFFAHISEGNAAEGGRFLVGKGGAIELIWQGDSSNSTYIKVRETTTTPANPSSGDGFHMYTKGDKLIIQSNDGTVKYRYLDLTSTDATWTYTTSAP